MAILKESFVNCFDKWHIGISTQCSKRSSSEGDKVASILKLAIFFLSLLNSYIPSGQASYTS